MYIETNVLTNITAPEERNVCPLKTISLLWSESIFCGCLSYKDLATLWPGLLIEL